jgi:hypothetical protein
MAKSVEFGNYLGKKEKNYNIHKKSGHENS